MKNWLKKVTMFLMSLAMILGLPAAAYAAEAPTATLSINGTKGATYAAYKVMDASNPSEGIYTYTVNKNFEGFFGDDQAYSLNADNEIIENKTHTVVATDGLSYDKESYNNSSAAAKLAKALADYAETKGITATDCSNPVGIGLYVIAETATAGDGEIASKPVLVDLTKDTTVTPKNDTVSLEKNVADHKNKHEESDWSKANNVNIGDLVDYRVNTAIPTYEANAKNLVFTLTDTFSKGLTFDADTLKVMVDGKEIAQGADTYTVTSGEHNYVVTFADSYIAANEGKTVTLTYSAKLNENAKVDSKDGNPNSIDLEYTNNPGTSTAHKTDRTTTFTYGLKIHKVDKNNETKDLAGAQFEIKDAQGNVITTYTYNADGKVVLNTDKDTDGKAAVTTDSNGLISIVGLDAGTYTITEVKPPKGYALLGSDVTVVIEDQGGTAPTGVAAITVSGAGSAETAVENQDGTIDLKVKIADTKGISLPETGSRNAMYFLALGAVFVAAGAAVFTLASRKKRGSN